MGWMFNGVVLTVLAVMTGAFAQGAPATAPAVIYSTSFERGLKEGGDWGKLFPGAELVHEYGRAHGGEQFLAVKGRNSNSQYSLATRSISVTAGSNYNLSFAYRFSPKVERNGIMVMFFCFDAQRKPIAARFAGWGNNGHYPFMSVNGPGTGQWQTFHKELLVPPGVASVEIHFRHINLPPDQEVDLDDVELAAAPPTVKVAYKIDSSRQILRGHVILAPASMMKHMKALHVILREYDPQANVRPALVPGTDQYNTDFTILKYGSVRRDLTLPPGQNAFEMDLSDLEDRPYALSVLAELNEGTRLQSHDTIESAVFYKMVHPQWAGNQLGILGKNEPPPPPWTPLRYEAEHQTVVDWNNRLQFGNHLMLRAVEFASPKGQQLFASSPQLLIGGKPAEEVLSFAEPKVVEQSPHAITLQSSGTNQAVTLSMAARVEFDGFIRYTLRLTALRDCQAGPVEMVFPLNKGVARFVHPNDIGWNTQRAVLDKDHPAWKTDDYRASVWIGNEEVGLACCIHSDQPGEAIDPNGPKLASELADGRWRLALLPGPNALKAGQNRTITFGVQPTPTRPLMKGFRDLVMRGKVKSGLELLWSSPASFQYCGFPQQRDEAITKWARQVKSRPDAPLALIYLTTGYHMTTVPAATWFADRWGFKGAHSAYLNEMPGWRKWTGDLIPLKVDDPLWQDDYCWHLDQLLSQSEVDGLYFDVSAGTLGAHGDILATRDFQKRIYVILKRHRPNGVIMFHAYENSAAPFLSFSALELRGEAYRQGLAEHDHYLDFLSLDEFRCNETTTGQGIVFLPQYRQLDKQQNPALAAQTLGLIQLHDMNLYPSWINETVIQRVRDFKRAFGPLEGARFYPYWQTQPGLVRVDSPAIVHSTYDRNGDLYALVFNKSQQPVHAMLKLAPTVEKSSATLFNPADGESRTVDVAQAKEKGIELNLQPSECRWLAVK